MKSDIQNLLKLSSNRPKQAQSINRNWMNEIAKTPRVDSVNMGRKVYSFLSEKPGKWHTFAEIAAGMGIPVQRARNSSARLWQLCQLGKLERRDVANPRGGLPIVQYRAVKQ